MTSVDQSDARGLSESIVDALLPNRADEALDELANVTFIDDGVDVAVSPVDQLIMTLTRRAAEDPALGGAAIVELPRSRNRSALLLAIGTHLLCRRPPARHRGPVVLISFDVDITSQLRALSVRHHRRMGLADGNPLSLHRLTRFGAIRPAVGGVIGEPDRSLIYFNTRVGAPALTCRAPIVILDATRVSYPAARRRALDWALEHNAVAVVVVGDLGDDGLVETVTSTGLVPTVVPISDVVVADLVATLGFGTRSQSTLSSMDVLLRRRTSVAVYRVPGDEINDIVFRAFASLYGRPDGPLPRTLNPVLTLLRNGSRLAAKTTDYRTACTYNLRPGESPFVDLLDRDTWLPPMWGSWKVTRLGSLKVAVRALWRFLDEENPKLRELWRVLDQLARDGTGPIAIRCHSRAAADATKASLCADDRTPAQSGLWERLEDRVCFSTFKDRFPAGTFDAQILTSPPPPWLFSVLLGIEATSTHILAYEAEEAMLRRQGQRWANGITGWHQTAARTFGAPAPPAASSPLPDLSASRIDRLTPHIEVPGFSLSEVLDLAASALDHTSPDQPTTMREPSGGGARRCIPVELADGHTWWCIDEDGGATAVLVITAAGHDHRAVKDLRPGDRIVVPAGEGIESIHARLVSASRSNDDVRALDMILSQFRSAARFILLSTSTQREAIERLKQAGAEAAGQLSAWAKGTTIAPREPGDVAAVFRAAGRPCPDLGLVYAVASKLRGLNRTLGRFVSAVASGGGDETIDQLRELVGPVADELLDEFIVAEVAAVGTSQSVSSVIAGRLR